MTKVLAALQTYALPSSRYRTKQGKRDMSFNRNRSAVGVVSVIVTALIFGTPGSAMAAEDQPAPARSVVEDVNEVAPPLDVAQGADVSSTRAAAIVSSAGEGASQVVVSRSAADGVSFSTEDGDALNIGLPLSTQAQPAQVVGGTAVYGDQATDVSVAVQPIDDGSVRALIAIPDAQAPAEYRFPVTVPPGGGIELIEDGSVEIINGEGETIAVFAPAWAKDANGKDLASSYRVEGNTVVQTVDLAAADAFPVVADPWVQSDCGWVTCTLRFDRPATRNSRDAGWVIGAAAGACAVISAGTLAVVCGAAVSPAAVVIAVAAGRYYEVGNCLGVRFNRLGGLAWPVEVRQGTYNCR